MKNWNRLAFTSTMLIAVLGIVSLWGTAAFAQGRLSQYTTSSIYGEWNDLSNSESASYIGDEIHGWSGQDENGNNITTTLPFAFKYDNATIASGSTIYVGPDGISFQSPPPAGVQYGGLASSSYPGDIFIFGGAYTNAGSGYNQGESYYGIYTETDGVSPNRVFTIQLTDVHSGFYSGAGGNNYDGSYSTAFLCSMQIKLFEGSGNIQMLYQSHDQDLGGYGDPNNPYYYDPYYQSAIGLNGFTTPSFQSLTYQSGVYSTPSSDLQFSPPAPPQELSLTPKTINFGTTTPQNPVTQTVTVSSVGGPGSTLHITGHSLSGSTAYSIVSGPSDGTAIPQGSSLQYTLQFLPFSNGTLNGTFTVVTDGVDSGTQHVSLTGVGAVADVSYSSNVMFRGTAIEVDSTSGVQYLYVNSTGNGPLTVNSVQLVGIDRRAYTITHVPPGVIPPGGMDSIGVKFSPDLEGIPDAHMIITSTGVNNPSDTVLMAGVGILPHLALSGPPDNVINNIDHTLLVNFDSVKLGSNSCMQVLISNPGSDTVAILQNYLSSKDFDFTLNPLTSADTLIPPGGTQTLQVCFSPLQRGYRTATVTLRTNIPVTQQVPPQDTSKFYIQFIGTGVPSGQLSISGPTNDTLAEGTQGCVVDTFWNDGSADVTVTNVTINGTNASVFTTSNVPTLPFTIPANSSTVFTVCADPSDTGTITASLLATGMSGTTPVSAPFQLFTYGTSIDDTAVLAKALGATTCLPGSDTAWVVVQNRGNVPEAYTASVVTGLNSNDFTVVAPATSPIIAAGGTTRFMVAFTPSTNSTESVSIDVTGGKNITTVVLGFGGSAAINGSGVAPATEIGQTSTAFTATVQNTGTCDWTPGVPTSDDAEFTYQGGGTTAIPAGQSGTLTYTYTPVTGGAGVAHLSFPSAIGVSMPAAVVTLTAAPLGVAMTSSNGYSLDQNYPNPFGSVNQTSEVEITLPTSSEVTLSIVDVTGKVVERVLDRHFDAGSYTVSLDATNLSSGTYYYQMSASGVTLMRQMVVVK